MLNLQSAHIKPFRKSIFASAVLAAALFAVPALAHKTFLWPAKFMWQAGDTVEIALTSALAFPKLEFGPGKDRIAFSSVVLAGQEIDATTLTENKTYLNMTFKADHAGFGVAAMSSKTRSGAIKPEDTEGYLEEIGANAAVRKAFNNLPGNPPLNRSYNKHTKTFLCVETCTDGANAKYKPVGQKLEFVASKSGDRKFVLLLDGKPLAGQDVVVYDIDDKGHKTVTDKNGMVIVDHPHSGAAMLTAVWITMPAKPDGVYHSDYTALTLKVAHSH
ncbi:MAG: DUF4198 domain-containing protein [Robiginitomaculum sp.]|nr:DUF4198 domain-containing protein [Robiginitomaculum sp.]